MAAQRRKKIAILGGGVGAMTAAFELTAQKDWQKRYEVTVYQIGWRLGGKGASGRNHAAQDRIEEHGLHILLGFYDNAFNVLKRCYGELGRPAGAPLATWRDAFKPHNLVVFSERVGGEWQEWPIEFPIDDEEPGGRDVALKVWEYVPLLLGWMSDLFVAPTAARRPHGNPGTPWARCIQRLLVDVEGVALTVAAGWLGAAHWLARSLDADPSKHRHEAHHTLVWLLDKFTGWLWRHMEHVVDRDAEARHLFMALDLSAAIITGLIVDEVIFRGFDSIDDLELHEWLEKHGASKRLTLDGSWTRAAYNLPFAYRYGDTRRPCAAAGTALRGVLRMVLTYKGAIMWKMQAGMGDTIFGPLYEVLERRGVRFEFFHRVKQLHPAADGRTIERISLGRQVRLKQPRNRKTKAEGAALRSSDPGQRPPLLAERAAVRPARRGRAAATVETRGALRRPRILLDHLEGRGGDHAHAREGLRSHRPGHLARRAAAHLQGRHRHEARLAAHGAPRRDDPDHGRPDLAAPVAQGVRLADPESRARRLRPALRHLGRHDPSH